MIFNLFIPLTLIVQTLWNSHLQTEANPTNLFNCSQNETSEETWLYHQESGKCFESNLVNRGPCNEMEVFVQDSENPHLGFCICDDIWTDDDKYTLESCTRKRPRIEYNGQCYSAFHQGPCQDNYWLILNSNSNGESHCELNPCLKNDDQDKQNDKSPYNQFFWFLGPNNTCYQTFTQGYCPLGRFLTFSNDSWKPICSTKEVRIVEEDEKRVYCFVNHGIGSVGANFKCKVGEKKNHFGRCQVISKFDL